jgi:hypothetical protein
VYPDSPGVAGHIVPSICDLIPEPIRIHALTVGLIVKYLPERWSGRFWPWVVHHRAVLARLRSWVLQHLPASVGVLVLGVFVLGLVLWVKASSGSKQAELGTSVLSGLVVGVVVGAALRVAQVAMSRDADRRQVDVAMSASTEPVPIPDEPPVDLARLAPQEEEGRKVPVHGHFRVEYEGTQRDTSRLDAQQLRLRVFANDAYFQFVTVPVPGPELRACASDVLQGQLWSAIAHAACPRIEDAVRRREIPVTDPIQAFEVYVDVMTTAPRVRYGQVEEITTGQTVCEFDI